VDLRAVADATGTGIYTLSLLDALGRRGSLRLLGMADKPPKEMQRLTAAAVSVEHHPAPLGFLWQQVLLPRRLARGDVDLFWSPLLSLPLHLPVPAVVTAHDLTTVVLRETHRLRVRLSILPSLRRSLQMAARVVVTSQSTAADLSRLFPECAARVQVIPCGVDPQFRPGTSQQVTETRRELGCPDGYLFFAGALEPTNNLSFLLDAWESLRRIDSGTLPLVLAGCDSGCTRNLHRLKSLQPLGLQHLGRVSRERLLRLLQAATVFIYPSPYAGFGAPVVEAMACGVPTVVSNASSLPELVGEAGLHVTLDDTQGLAGAIRTLLADPSLAARLGQRGLARSRRFDWNESARQMEELFAEVVQSSRYADALTR
jgi:glycosyltransferase involved in cell wall biosynthesis